MSGQPPPDPSRRLEAQQEHDAPMAPKTTLETVANTKLSPPTSVPGHRWRLCAQASRSHELGGAARAPQWCKWPSSPMPILQQPPPLPIELAKPDLAEARHNEQARPRNCSVVYSMPQPTRRADGRQGRNRAGHAALQAKGPLQLRQSHTRPKSQARGCPTSRLSNSLGPAPSGAPRAGIAEGPASSGPRSAGPEVEPHPPAPMKRTPDFARGPSPTTPPF
mmetsp:Transcript_3595/g.11824  ORF Transcript_3595/g.11824 Transcript_3595/m.11824 type:complete len:221 (+) Transcript_3595:288-950(+)